MTPAELTAYEPTPATVTAVPSGTVQLGATSAGVRETLQSLIEVFVKVAPGDAASFNVRSIDCATPLGPLVVSGRAVGAVVVPINSE